MCHLGAASSRPGSPVGGACFPLRQIRRVRQRDHNDDEPSDRRVEGESLQGRRDEGRQHRDLLPSAPVLPRLQATATQRPPARADAAHGSHSRRQLLPESWTHSTRQTISQGCPGTVHWFARN